MIPTKLSPLTVSGFSERSASLEDVHGIHSVFVAVDLVDGTSFAGSADEYEIELTRKDLNRETDTRVVISPEGTIVAAAWFHENQDKSREHYAYLYAAIHPEYCGRGIGTWLLNWLETAAGGKVDSYADQKPRFLTTTFRQGLIAREGLFRRFGYSPVRTYFKMRCDLRGGIEPPRLAVGMDFVPYSADIDGQMHQLMDTSFREHHMFQPHTDELWALHTLRNPAFCPQASYLVIAGSVPAGATVCSIWTEDNERLGIKEGWVEMLGVLKEFRGCGIGSALLLQTMQAFHKLGMDYTGLFVDSENGTGALALYERLGFRRIMSSNRWTKYLG